MRDKRVSEMTDDEIRAMAGASDPLIAVLEEIREQREWTAIFRLAKALEAALELIPQWKQFAARGDAQDECADELRRVIAAALTGNEGAVRAPCWGPAECVNGRPRISGTSRARGMATRPPITGD